LKEPPGPKVFMIGLIQDIYILGSEVSKRDAFVYINKCTYEYVQYICSLHIYRYVRVTVAW
jgi:hypothetical protein